jgi:hypothetical protein
MGDFGVAEEQEVRRLADARGVLVFDYPNSDAEYTDRIFTKLDKLGVVHSDA